MFIDAKAATSSTKYSRQLPRYSKELLYCMDVITSAVEACNYSTVILFNEVINSSNIDDVTNKLEEFGYRVYDTEDMVSISWEEPYWDNVKTV